MSNSAIQLSLEDIGTPLHSATFVVLDFETTGGSARADAITEIGAVKVCGGDVIGEFRTFVDPQTCIDPFVQALTGITDAHVRGAPTIAAALPMFLEFAGLDRGAILVAHNARFDVGFLRAAARDLDIDLPRLRTLDTVLLARRTLSRDEVPNHKLATLAAYLDVSVQPIHRALDDARATVEVMHRLFERVGSFGIQSVEELLDYVRETTPAQRTKRHLADSVPTGPGVYIFRSVHGEALYIGKSAHLRRRVRTYFTASEPRARIRDMIAQVARVDAVECAHDLEAQVRELRLIDALQPRYNRRSKSARKAVWLRLTNERFPRLSLVPRPRGEGALELGPFPSRRVAEAARDAIYESIPLRRCTDRITARSAPSPCALRDMRRCLAPCTGELSTDEYADVLVPLTTAMNASPDALVGPLLSRIDTFATVGRYEDAAVARDRTTTLLRAIVRQQQLASLGRLARVVLAAPAPQGAWHIAVIVRGRLVSAARADRASAVLPIVAALRPAEQHFANDPVAARGRFHEETQILWRWMHSAGARIVEIDGTFSSPVDGAARWLPWLQRADPRSPAPRR